MSQPMDDHDLLVRLDAKLDVLSASFGEMKSSVSGKADAQRVDKLEIRQEATERKMYMIVGGLAALEFALKWWTAK